MNLEDVAYSVILKGCFASSHGIEASRSEEGKCWDSSSASLLGKLLLFPPDTFPVCSHCISNAEKVFFLNMDTEGEARGLPSLKIKKNHSKCI